jgi:hypothetical protein
MDEMDEKWEKNLFFSPIQLATDLYPDQQLRHGSGLYEWDFCAGDGAAWARTFLNCF